MARGLRGLPRCGLWLLLAHHLFMVTACRDPDYGTLIQELCLSRFKENMETIGKTLWCDWGKTIQVCRKQFRAAMAFQLGSASCTLNACPKGSACALPLCSGPTTV
uniref:Receptor activity-modifying protein 1 n=1 Tax=Mus spicilegus TaxID=10103 RepID=A0A8C6I167_MUSSI